MQTCEWVWIVGGGQMQLPMAQEIKRRGYALIITDGDENCSVRPLADKFACISTYDIVGHICYLNKLRQVGISIRAVLTDAADVGLTVSYLAQQLGLPAATLGAAEVVNHKAKLRAALEYPHPVYKSFYAPEDCTTLADEWEYHAANQGIPPYPCVIKPADNCASRGITRVYTPHALLGAVERAREHSRALVPTILIEECLQGQEYAFDFLVRECRVWQGELRPWKVCSELQVTYLNGAKRLFGEFGIETGHINPIVADKQVLELARDIVGKTGLDQGPFKMDLIDDPRYGLCVLECATRLSGGWDHTHSGVMATG